MSEGAKLSSGSITIYPRRVIYVGFDRPLGMFRFDDGKTEVSTNILGWVGIGVDNEDPARNGVALGTYRFRYCYSDDPNDDRDVKRWSTLTPRADVDQTDPEAACRELGAMLLDGLAKVAQGVHIPGVKMPRADTFDHIDFMPGMSMDQVFDLLGKAPWAYREKVPVTGGGPDGEA